MALKRFDVNSAELYPQQPGAPERFGSLWASIHAAIGGENVQGNLIVVPPGVTAAPYHWEASIEEWLLVLAGTPTVRTPEGEQELRRGDVVCFPAGPEGAHQVINRAEEEARIVLLSDFMRPEVIVYPDSGKVMITARGVDTILPISAGTTYWDGE